MVKRITGVVLRERAGVAQAVVPGQTLLAGDTIRTGRDSAVGITLADDTLLAIGPDSELVLNEFAFNSTTQDGNMLASLWRGTLGVVTGLIGRKTPENVRVQTRTVVLGVRGTAFIVDTKGAPQ